MFDSVSLADTQNLAYDALAPGGTLVLDLPSEIKEDKLVADKKVVNAYGIPNTPPNHKLGVALYAKLTEWLADGSIKVCVHSAMEGLGRILIEGCRQAESRGGAAEWACWNRRRVGEVAQGSQRLEAGCSSPGDFLSLLSFNGGCNKAI